ncbi:zinc-binding dehydrogenase [Fodinicurvata halophila]
MGAKVSGAETIIAVDLEATKLERARILGATHCFDARDPELVEKIKELTSGGVDHAIELAGAVPAMKSAYAVTARGGRVVTAGLSPIGAEFAFEHGELVSNEKSICGSYMGSCVPVRDIPRFIKLYRSGALPVDQLLDGVIGLEDINEGFDRLASGHALRQILAPNG